MRRSFRHSLGGVLALATIGSMAGIPGTAHAAGCDPGKAGNTLTGAEAAEVYDCLKQSLYEGYQKGSKQWIPARTVKAYRDWTPVSTIPAAPGVHGGRFLFTYVNELGAAEYLKYASVDVNIPAGTLIAKESFSVTAKGKARKGPLFFMEKVARGTSPETNDWYYYAVAASGKPMAVDVVKACHACHAAYAHQGNLGYPVPDARVR